MNSLNLFGERQLFQQSSLLTYLIGNPKALPSLRKINSAVALKMNPIPAKIVSVMSRINEPECLQEKSRPFYLHPKSYFE